MNWNDLIQVLAAHVPAGRVTTYAQVSMHGYGVPNRNQPVGAMLAGARNHGHQVLTNRVVAVDGGLVDLPDGTQQQRNQLQAEGILFTATGKVDFGHTTPVQLPPRL